MTHASGSTANAHAVPRCVLLVGESGAVPSSLVGALDRRGLDIIIVRQAPQVMLELAPPGSSRPQSRAVDTSDEEACPSKDRPPSAASAGLSVVIVEPQQQPRIDELQDAIAAYYPAVRCWQYHAHGPDGGPSLDLLHAADFSSAAANDPEAEASQASGKSPGPTATPPNFVDTGDSDPHTSGKENPADPRDTARVKGASQRLRSLVVKVDDPQPYDDGPLVSEEELAMLLGSEPSDADPAALGIHPDSSHPDGERE
ncbi:MAG: hypothetical protein AAF086_05230 [Planctomycetota bacterium]